MPTACSMSRGWTTFITMNQPTPIANRAGRIASGLVKIATRTGGSHATKGPKNGIAIRTPLAALVMRHVVEAERRGS